MLVYEHERTEEIVSRLLAAAQSIRVVCMVICILVFGAGGVLIGALLSESFGVWIGLLGAIVGLGLGAWLGALAILLLEWLAQLLVVQGEVLAALRER